MTLVHELGHAFHVHCQIGKTELQKVTPMTLAETASIFNERIVIEALLSDASSNDEQLRILETQLMAEAMIIVDTTSRFLFEREVFERRSQSELSTEEFCDVMLRAQADTYGDGLDERHRHPYMWAWKPHYYQTDVSFYNFPYVFGLLFGIGLWALYKEHGDSFIPEYEAMLSSSGEGTAMELAARFGIDLHRPEFWQASLKAIEERVEQYLAL